MLAGFEKRSFLLEKADRCESSRRFDELFSPRLALASFILVTGANIALLAAVVRRLLREASQR